MIMEPEEADTSAETVVEVRGRQISARVLQSDRVARSGL